MDILRVSIWFGLLAGLVEGAIFLLMQQAGWIMFVWTPIIYVAPIFDAFLFALLGLGLLLLHRACPRWPILKLTFFMVIFLALADWLSVALSIQGWVKPYAVAPLALGIAFQLARSAYKRQASLVRFLRRTLVPLAGMTLLLLVVVQAGAWLKQNRTPNHPPADNAPNVLMLVVDTLRADHLSTYGYARPTSPNLDRLASQSVLFERASSAASWTLPSHASLLNGRFPHEHHASWAHPQILQENHYPTLGQALKDQGYRTAAFSANLYWFTRAHGFGHGFDHFEDFFSNPSDTVLRTFFGRVIFKVVQKYLGFEDIPGRKHAADINRSFLRWLDHRPDQPFFGFLNYLDAHDPYLPPQPYRSQFSDTQNPGGILNGEVFREQPDMTPQQRQGEIDAYDGGIAYADDQIGQLLNELDTRGLADNTLVIFTSDHGEEFLEHGLYLHGSSVYRESIHVPLVVRYPGKTPQGVRISKPVSIVAIPATIMDLLGLADQSPFPGPPLTPLWQSPQKPDQQPMPALAQVEHKPWAPQAAPAHTSALTSLFFQQWHCIHSDDKGWEIYDWKTDPGETRDLADTDQGKEVIAQLPQYQ